LRKIKGYDWQMRRKQLRSWKKKLIALYNINKVAEQMPRYGPGQLIYPRLGQGSFRFAVEQAYQQCAVTKEHSIPALEAAHIKPYSLGGFHEVNNPKIFYLFFANFRIIHLIYI